MTSAILAGLTIGAIYVLVAQGFNLVLLATGTFNFSQAAVVMLGTFIAFHFGYEKGYNPLLVILIGALIGAVVGAITELIAIRPVAGKGLHSELVTTIGVLTVIQGVIVLIWGGTIRPIKPLISSRIVEVLDGRISVDAILLIVVAVAVAGALWALSRFTLSGIASLATAEDRDAASLRGINVSRLSILALAAAGALGGAAGPFVGTQTFAVATVAAAVTIKAFVALSIGGFGSFPGAAIGGFAVGLIESFSGRYIGGQYPAFVLFGVLMLVLTLWPTGLFGQKAERVV